MKRAADHLPELVRALALRTVYADLDGTLLGPGGSLFAGPDGPTALPARAVNALHEAGVDLVIVSGRTRSQIAEVARVLGARAYIAEMGGLVVYREPRSEEVIRMDGVRRGKTTAARAIGRTGAAATILEAYPGRLEPHAPWAFLDRECSMLLRGNIPIGQARALLHRHGYSWLDVLDNGILPAARERFPGLEVDEVHVYHLVPSGVSKERAIAFDRTHRGLDRDSCISVGDSASDATVAPAVGAVFIVANGEPGMRVDSPAENVYLMDRPNGTGFADAVLPFLSGR